LTSYSISLGTKEKVSGNAPKPFGSSKEAIDKGGLLANTGSLLLVDIRVEPSARKRLLKQRF
jgi:hypothetical protein